MIEDDFYATLKFENGEEIFAKIAASEEQDRTMLIISNPVMVKEIKSRADNVVGYKLEPWLKTTSEDMFIINIDKVLTLSESSDIQMIMMYQEYVRNGEPEEVYDYAKEILEKIYKRSKESK